MSPELKHSYLHSARGPNICRNRDMFLLFKFFQNFFLQSSAKTTNMYRAKVVSRRKFILWCEHMNQLLKRYDIQYKYSIKVPGSSMVRRERKPSTINRRMAAVIMSSVTFSPSFCFSSQSSIVPCPFFLGLACIDPLNQSQPLQNVSVQGDQSTHWCYYNNGPISCRGCSGPAL